MSDYVLFDAFRLIVFVPKDLKEPAGAAIQRTLEGQPFRSALRRGVRQLVRQYPELDPIRVRISV